MIALDTNVVVAAMVSSASEHSQVLCWLKNNNEPLAIPVSVIGESLRLLTHPKVFQRPLKLKEALEITNQFISFYEMSVLDESPDWWRELNEIADKDPLVRGNIIFDARICLCLKFNGVKKIASFDSDLSRFSFVKRLVPDV